MPKHADRSGANEAAEPLRAPESSTGAAGVTAVVVAYNSAQHLSSLGRSLVSGTLVPTRMLVVDNASVDSTVTSARSAGFEVYETGSNNGFGAGCNAGLRVATTEYVLFCNPDVRPSPCALERLHATLASAPTAAIAGAVLDDQTYARSFSKISANVLSFVPGTFQHMVQRLLRNVAVGQREGPVVVDYAVGAFILCRADALHAVGGFDERFFLYSEEEDLSRRLGECGWQTLLVPPATAAHAFSTSSDGIDRAVMSPFRFHSLYWYYRKYHSRLYAELARCAIAVCVTVDRAYRAVSRRPQVYGSRAAFAAFRSIAAVRRDLARHPPRRDT